MTTNRFFVETLNPVFGSLIQGAPLNAQMQGIQEGFTLVAAELDRLQGISGITSLSGFPSSFANAALKYLRVNAAESAVEFIPGGRLSGVRSIGGTAYTLVAADAGWLLIFTNAAAVTVTVPPAILAQGDVVCIRQGAAGLVTLAPGSGVTFQSSDNLLATRKQGAQIAVVCDGGNAFGVIGERNAVSLGVALVAAVNVFTQAQGVTPVALTDATTIATDGNLSNHFTVTLAGTPRTLANPTNLRDGFIYNWLVTQDGTGSRTLAYGNKFKWAGGAVPVLSTAPAARDYISAQYFLGADILVSSIIKGLA
ncbi:MAG: hypothetical protein RL030_1789 [Pseudomonadota bacterium]